MNLKLLSLIFFSLITLATPPVPVKFNIDNSGLSSLKLAPMGAARGQVLKYNGTTWTPIDLGEAKFIGLWEADDAGAGPALGGASTSGEYYIVSKVGTVNINGITTWSIGDWVIYDGANWQKIDKSTGVKSLFGRTGNVTVSWSDILTGSLLSGVSDLNLAGLGDGDILSWHVGSSQWVRRKNESLGYSNPSNLILQADNNTDGTGETSLEIGGNKHLIIASDGKVKLGSSMPTNAQFEIDSGAGASSIFNMIDNVDRNFVLKQSGNDYLNISTVDTSERIVLGNLVTSPEVIFSSVSVGIGASADTTSILDIPSTSQGIIISKMTTTQRDAISTPAEGLMIFNTTENRVNYYDGSSWSHKLSNGSDDLSMSIFGTRFPIVTNAERSAMTPIEGTVVYNSETNLLNVFVNGSWKEMDTEIGITSYGVKYTKMSAGHDAICAISEAKNVYCWGDGGQMDLGQGHAIDTGRPVIVKNLDGTNISDIILTKN